MKTNEILIKKTDKSVTETVVRQMSKLKDDMLNIIKFENAVYRFDKVGAYRDIFNPIYNPKGEKNVMFPAIGVKNLVIDGGGATFLLEDRVYPFIAQKSENIVFRNFTIDFSFPRYAYTRVVDAGENGFTLEIVQKDLSYKIDEKNNLVFRTGSGEISTGKRKFFIQNTTNESNSYLCVGDTEDNLNDLPAAVVFTEAEDLGGGRLRFAYRGGSCKFNCKSGDTVVLSYDENRENSVFFIDECRNVHFDNVRIYRGAGFGILAHLSENIHIENCFFGIPEDRKDTEIISITADLMHFVNCSGTALIENNIFEDCLDDAVNIHGQYIGVKKVLSDNRIEADFFRTTHSCKHLYYKGDRLTLIDGKTKEEKGKVTVLDVECEDLPNTNILRVKFAENIEDMIAPGDLLENPMQMPVVVIKGNKITNCPHMRLSSSKYMEISNNLLRLNRYSIYISDLMQYWHESGRVHSVLIEKNVFEDMSPSGNAGDVAIRQEREGSHKYYHENIIIRENKFKLRNGAAINAEDVINLSCENNDLGGSEVKINNCIKL